MPKMIKAMNPYTKEFESLMESLPVMVWTKNPEGEREFFNKRWTDYCGMPANAKWDWLDLIHPEDHDKALRDWEESLRSGKVYEFECRLRRHDGQYRWHLSRAIPVFNNENKIAIWVGICLDVHANKTKEEELQMKNKELSQVNNDLDNFIYTASHDLKAPISNVEGLVEALKEESCYNMDFRHRELLEMLDQSMLQLKRTINDLSEITKVQREARDDIKVLSISDTLEEVITDISPLIKESGAVIHKDLKADNILFSKKNLRSVLYNLLSNAIKFRSFDRTPEITISSFQEDNQLILSIKDNGLGIDLSQENKLFLMFKKLHAHVDGSGVGLYIVKRIIENNGGSIKVDSEVGKGSTFTVYFKKDASVETTPFNEPAFS